MEKANIEEYGKSWHELKLSGPCRASNCFLDANELEKLLEQKDCLSHKTDSSLFLFVPYHNSYYDCIYLSKDNTRLLEDIAEIKKIWPELLPIRLSIIGKGASVSQLSEDAEKLGFKLLKKLIRFQIEKAPEKIMAAMEVLGLDYLPYADFARPEDAEEILNLISSEFELVSENLPELEAIRANIDKKQVTVLRMDNKIAALHYFMIEHNICHGYYDVVRKEYRDRGGLFFGISMFERQYFKNAGIRISRTYGWRDAAAERLVKSSRKTNAREDGVAIYNHLWQPLSDKAN